MGTFWKKHFFSDQNLNNFLASRFIKIGPDSCGLYFDRVTETMRGAARDQNKAVFTGTSKGNRYLVKYQILTGFSN